MRIEKDSQSLGQPVGGTPVRRMTPLTESLNFSGMVGKSKKMIETREMILVAAKRDFPILILGETGTGKELVAAAIHANSKRAGGPYIAVNCPGIPESLAESELFGHEKGSFTGAALMHRGYFETANKGTLFLDEFGDLTHSTQARLLRVLNEGEFRRVGGASVLRSDFRLITATNRDMKTEIEAGTFRRDLFHRISTYIIRLPPLRERLEDVPSLAMHFLQNFNIGQATEVRFERDALKLLQEYDFPGNVRELKTIIERAASVAEYRGRPIDVDIITTALGNSEDKDSVSEGFSQSTGNDTADRIMATGVYNLEIISKAVVLNALRAHRGNKEKTSEALGVSSKTLYNKLKEWGIKLKDYKANLRAVNSTLEE